VSTSKQCVGNIPLLQGKRTGGGVYSNSSTLRVQQPEAVHRSRWQTKTAMSPQTLHEM
jgi:hypothetical protein